MHCWGQAKPNVGFYEAADAGHGFAEGVAPCDRMCFLCHPIYADLHAAEMWVFGKSLGRGIGDQRAVGEDAEAKPHFLYCLDDVEYIFVNERLAPSHDNVATGVYFL